MPVDSQPIQQPEVLPRDPDHVVETARRNAELMRQLDQSLDDERRDEPDTPFHQILREKQTGRFTSNA
jgi:hypothetical protein